MIGIVSRSDLLRLYLRDDATIKDEIIGQVLLRTLWIDPETITVSVHGGVAGVVDVIDEMTYDYDDTAGLHRHNFMGATVKETTP